MTQGFQWNAGGWFGSQIGGSCWMLIAGVLFMAQDVTAGLVLIGLFAAVNAVGTWLWTRRARMECYTAMQTLIAILGAAAVAALLAMQSAAGAQATVGAGGVSVGSMWYILLIFPAMMIFFRSIHRAKRA